MVKPASRMIRRSVPSLRSPECIGKVMGLGWPGL